MADGALPSNTASPNGFRRTGRVATAEDLGLRPRDKSFRTPCRGGESGDNEGSSNCCTQPPR
jgi:hypothetical protein